MQVNKRDSASIDAIESDLPKRAKHALDVEDASLKYQNSDAEGSSKDISNIDEANEDDVDTNIDSELLSHQAQSYTESQEDAAQSYLTSVGGETSPEEIDTESKQLDDDIVQQVEDEQDAATNQETHRSSQQILHQSSEKPLAGTEEWHRIRKDNHKEVERRRRENINSGIKELSTLLPAPESNKSQILQRAIEYIKRLKENENNNIEKWTLEKLLTDQALAELTASNEKLKAELERAYREVEHWKKACSINKDDK